MHASAILFTAYLTVFGSIAAFRLSDVAGRGLVRVRLYVSGDTRVAMLFSMISQRVPWTLLGIVGVAPPSRATCWYCGRDRTALLKSELRRRSLFQPARSVSISVPSFG
jgi:hypothetical protein